MEQFLQKKNDLLAIFVLLVVFTPLYLFRLYEIPWQVNTDEIVVMMVSERAATFDVSPLGVRDDYFGFPNLEFLMLGRLNKLLGGVTLHHARMVHASFGLVIIVLYYLFLRQQSVSPFIGFAGSVILGANHALLGISRMAIRDNLALLTELTALTVLIHGLRKESRLLSLLGGGLAGLTFYCYYPARITIWIWALSFLILWVLKRMQLRKGIVIGDFNLWCLKRAHLRMGMTLGALNALGFLVIALPIIIAALRSPNASMYPRQQFLIFQEGRQLQMAWSSSKTPEEAVKKNILNGLTAFNNTLHDHGYIYPNYNHGFLDPLTGVLIWLGLGLLLMKPKKKEADIVILVGFFTLWLLFSFLITKAPIYTRLLTTLPFTSFLAITAIKTIGDRLRAPLAGKSVVMAVVITIVLWNLSIWGDFVSKGTAEGNDVGGTARYVESRNKIADYHFYLAADHQYPYYSWGEHWQWKDWLGFFTVDHQKATVLSPADFIEKLGPAPFTVFLRDTLWKEQASKFIRHYPTFKTHPIKTDGSLLAIEVS